MSNNFWMLSRKSYIYTCINIYGRTRYINTNNFYEYRNKKRLALTVEQRRDF